VKLAPLCAAWLSGAAAFAWLGLDAWPLAIATAAFGIACAITRPRWRTLLYAAALPAAFAVALWHANASEPALATDSVAHFNDGAAMRVRGVVRADPDIRDTTQRFAVAVREIQMHGEWHGASGGILVTVPLYPRYKAGDLLVLEGALESPPRLDGFDYADYLARRGIQSIMAFPRVRLAGHEDPAWHVSAILRTRRELSRGLALALPEPHASLAQGVLLGERSALPPELLDDLNVTNTSHLVVVSGSNVVLVAGYATFAFAWLLGRRAALLLSIVAVLAYAMLVGLDPPVARATIMGILLVVARFAGRRTDGLTAILLAASAMVAWSPAIVRDVSFQLSFAATAGIIWLASPIRDRVVDALAWLLRRERVPHWTAPLIVEPLAITIAAIIATTPIVGMNFGRLSLVAIPANMLVVPAFPLILVSSALAAIGGILPFAHVALGAPAYLLLEYWIAVAAWFARLPSAALSIDGYSTTAAALTYLLLGAALATLGLGRYRVRRETKLAPPIDFDVRALRSVAIVAAPVVVLAASAGFIAWPDEPRRLQVTVLDVGQGDAILIETPRGQDILIDGGPGRAVLRGLGAELPWHDRSIDLMVVSHMQADHAAGLVDVLDRYNVSRVLVPSSSGDSAIARALSRAAAREHASLSLARAGDTIDLGDGIVLQVLWPRAESLGDASNDDSLVLRLSWRDVSFLLTGDIGAATERKLIAAGADVRSTVLKVPHHGSATSSSEEFLAVVQPVIAVVSAGAGNPFGHPAPDVVQRLTEYARVFSTAEHGAVRFETDGERLWIDTSR